MSAVMVKSRTGTQRDEMLWTVHGAVRLLLTPPPLNYGALNVPRAVSPALALPIAHNHPAIQSKRRVNVLLVPGCHPCLATFSVPPLPPAYRRFGLLASILLFRTGWLHSLGR